MTSLPLFTELLTAFLCPMCFTGFLSLGIVDNFDDCYRTRLILLYKPPYDHYREIQAPKVTLDELFA